MAAWFPDRGEPLPLNHSKRTPEVVGLLVGSVERRATKKARTDGRAGGLKRKKARIHGCAGGGHRGYSDDFPLCVPL